MADFKTGRFEGKNRKSLEEKYQLPGAAYRTAVEKALVIKGVEFRLIFLRQA